jgi:hypothetical protein
MIFLIFLHSYNMQCTLHAFFGVGRTGCARFISDYHTVEPNVFGCTDHCINTHLNHHSTDNHVCYLLFKDKISSTNFN